MKGCSRFNRISHRVTSHSSRKNFESASIRNAHSVYQFSRTNLLLKRLTKLTCPIDKVKNEVQLQEDTVKMALKFLKLERFKITFYGASIGIARTVVAETYISAVNKI